MPPGGLWQIQDDRDHQCRRNSGLHRGGWGRRGTAPALSGMPSPPDTLSTQKLFTYIISFDPPHSLVILVFVVAPCVTARQTERKLMGMEMYF